MKKNDIYYSLDSFFHVLAEKIEKHAPIKTKSNKTITLNDKPWISRVIGTSIKIRDKIFKELLHEQFKTYRNNLVALTRIRIVTANISKKVKKIQKECGVPLE